MKVNELINELKKCNPDSLISVRVSGTIETGQDSIKVNSTSWGSQISVNNNLGLYTPSVSLEIGL